MWKLDDERAVWQLEDPDEYDRDYNTGAVLIGLFTGAVSGGVMVALMLWVTGHLK